MVQKPFVASSLLPCWALAALIDVLHVASIAIDVACCLNRN
jgi:hypothetical protein